MHLTNKEWQVIMSPQQFDVMLRAGTEAPSLSGNALDHRKGIYLCSACGNLLYSADAKFDSVPAGQVFGSRFANKPCAKATRSQRFLAGKFRARAVARILDMSSMMARSRLDCAIA